MGAALALGERGSGRTAPNPNVGCVIVAGGRVVGRGWTKAGGRPHAEAVALDQAGAKSRGATCYTTLEPCAHRSARGPTCTDLLIEAGIERVVAAIVDPDPRTAGGGFTRLRAAAVTVDSGTGAKEARAAMAGFLMRQQLGRPFVTLKLATSMDGCIAMADGSSRWITGAPARAHAHLERARHDAILVGRATLTTDAPTLDVRLPGLEDHAPRRVMLGSGTAPEGWTRIGSPDEIAALEGVDRLLVEGGAQTASSFLSLGLVDRLILYRAPILIGAGRPMVHDIGLGGLADAHGRWSLGDARQLGSDRLEVYMNAQR